MINVPAWGREYGDGWPVQICTCGMCRRSSKDKAKANGVEWSLLWQNAAEAMIGDTKEAKARMLAECLGTSFDTVVQGLGVGQPLLWAKNALQAFAGPHGATLARMHLARNAPPPKTPEGA